jgi:hypothetical protein
MGHWRPQCPLLTRNFFKLAPPNLKSWIRPWTPRNVDSGVVTVAQGLDTVTVAQGLDTVIVAQGLDTVTVAARTYLLYKQ